MALPLPHTLLLLAVCVVDLSPQVVQIQNEARTTGDANPAAAASDGDAVAGIGLQSEHPERAQLGIENQIVADACARARA